MRDNRKHPFSSESLEAAKNHDVLHSLAEAMINSKPLGAMVPMSPGAIEELNAAFGL